MIKYLCRLTIEHYCLDAFDNIRKKRVDLHRSDLTPDDAVTLLESYAKENNASICIWGNEVHLLNMDNRVYGDTSEPLHYEVDLDGKWVDA